MRHDYREVTVRVSDGRKIRTAKIAALPDPLDLLFPVRDTKIRDTAIFLSPWQV